MPRPATDWTQPRVLPMPAGAMITATVMNVLPSPVRRARSLAPPTRRAPLRHCSEGLRLPIFGHRLQQIMRGVECLGLRFLGCIAREPVRVAIAYLLAVCLAYIPNA